jgi:type II secretory pathway pseudopilin PulG
MQIFFKKTKRAFTLVETLVAVSIFTMSILGLLSILSQGISDTGYAKKKMVAAYLAQEGIEYIRNMRDTFVLYDATDAPTGWASFKNKLLSSSCQLSNGCYFNDGSLNYGNPSQPMAGITLTACGGSCSPLLYDGSTGKYGYVSGTNSGFIRKIQINPINTDEIRVFSTITWTQGSGSHDITFSEDLFNWVE